MSEVQEGAPNQAQAEFRSQTFDIKFLSLSPTGFEIQTKNSLLRHEPNTPLPFADRIAKVRAGEKRELRTGKEFKPKVGLRNIVQNGNELSFDIMPVTFPTYIAIGKPESTKEELNISNPTGTALILLTTESDGTHKFILQHRDAKNRLYGDIPGASVAGYFDGDLQRTGPNRGRLAPVTLESIKTNATLEMREEIGLHSSDISDLRITGVASDKIKVHNEFLLLATTKLSSEDLKFRSGMGDYFKFTERFFTFDATAENIEKLLTQVKTPLPPTHTAAFIAAGYSIILEKEGKTKAEEWKSRIQEGVNRNYGEINNTVRQYYINHPEQLQNVPDKKPPRNSNGYDPAYLPQEQGLPKTESEFERLGIVSKENIRSVDEAYVFDVDGVLTVPDGRAFDPEIMEIIAKKLSSNEPVILNTGRSVSWVQSNIIARLYYAHHVIDKSSLQNLFVVGEKGGTWMTFDEKGMMDTHKDGTISVPPSLQEKIRELIEKDFSDTMFYDHTKQTMISTEMKQGISLDQYRKAQELLVEKLSKLISDEKTNGDFEIDPTTIATDLQNKHVGKDFAMQRAVAWLEHRRIAPKKYIAFGDSKSDISMAQHLHEAGMNVEYVHVGDEKDISEDLPFQITVTKNKYNNGTKEYLNSK